MAYDFKVKGTYSFNTIAPGIIQTSVKNARLATILDFESAMLYEPIIQKFRQIFPLLPAGTPDTPESTIYYRFISESGEPIILAAIWIDDTSVVSVDSINFQVTFAKADVSDIARVRDVLNAMGYLNYQIKEI